MKKFLVAALAALTMVGAAAPALARENDRGERGSNEYRRDAAITVRVDGRQMRFDRGDRMFYRLLDRPFGFRPGRTYVYTDQCYRAGCRVLVFAPSFSRRPIDQTFAPRPFRRGRDGDWGRDGRGDDGRFDDRGRDDGRDGRWNDNDGRAQDHRLEDNRFDDDRLEGAPH